MKVRIGAGTGAGLSTPRSTGADGWATGGSPSCAPPMRWPGGKRVIDKAADGAGRAISPEHFGVSVGYAREPLDHRTAMAVAGRARGHDPRQLVPLGFSELREHIERFVDAGFSKFVVRPLAPPRSWPAELEDIAAAVGDRQT